MKTNRIVIVQCRLSSTRLPQKALKLLDSKPVLGWVLNSMKQIPADFYYVATDEASFSQLEPICKENNFNCFAGDLNNVLKRFCDLLKTVEADTVIRATADNPFLFYEAALESCELFEEKNKNAKKCDYLTYSGLPHGSGVEIFSAKSLLKAAELTDDPYDKEHVGPSLYNHKENFNCEFVPAPKLYNHPELRTTIDTYSDFLRALRVVDYLKKQNLNGKELPFTTEQVLEAINASEVKNPVIYAPSVTKGHGTGHLHRCLSAAIENNDFIYIPENSSLLETEELIMEYKEKGLKDWQIITELPDETYKSVIVSDSMELSEKQVQEFANQKTLIALDEGSAYTDNCDYLLDIIPSMNSDRLSNCKDSSFITKPVNVKKEKITKENIKNILICIGGEDPKNLTEPAIKTLVQLFPECKITAVLSQKKIQSGTIKTNFNNVVVSGPIKGLREQLFNYDLVVTHYGLTAFEAVYAGCGVVMVATSSLHEQLAQKYNFAYIPGSITYEGMKTAINSPKLFANFNMGKENKSLNSYVHELSKGQKLLCPICQKENTSLNSIVSRNTTRTYRRCNCCGMVYISFTAEPEKTYQKAYFFEDYKKQYGKTYQEDFQTIKQQCLRRLDVINSITNSEKNLNVLDIGCAYGPFLSAAYDKGFAPYGTDISQDAVEYVKKELNIPASCSAFPDIEVEEQFGISKFDICTMWYVIEHFKNLDTVLQKVSSILNKGGLFCFSTPSGEGVSAKSDKNHFYQISPTDHYSVWEPTKANKILNQYGFEVVKIVSTGHHPERFPSIKKSGAKPGSIRWKMINLISHIKNLGDTVEIYCRKIN